MKTILILGSGKDQLSAIVKAKELGLKVISCDKNKHAVGKKASDIFWNISNQNINKLKLKIKKYNNKNDKIDGVFVIGSDIPDIASKLSGLVKFNIYKRFPSINAKNKLLMKKIFTKFKIPTSIFKEIKSFKDLINFIKKHKTDIVIKPLDRSGARGVFLLKKDLRLKQIKSLYEKTKNVTKKNSIITEIFLKGLQISTESIVVNQKIKTIAYADRNYEHLNLFEPNIIENGGSMPSSLSIKKKYKINKLLNKVAKSFRISDGTIKGDIIISNKSIYLVEIAHRLSGGDFSESLIPLNTGIDFIGLSIKQALGEKISLAKIKVKNKNVVLNRYFFPKPGILKKVSNIKKIKNFSFIKKLELNYKLNDKIPKIENHADRAGVFIVIAKNKNVGMKRVKYVYSKLKFYIN